MWMKIFVAKKYRSASSRERNEFMHILAIAKASLMCSRIWWAVKIGTACDEVSTSRVDKLCFTVKRWRVYFLLSTLLNLKYTIHWYIGHWSVDAGGFIVGENNIIIWSFYCVGFLIVRPPKRNDDLLKCSTEALHGAGFFFISNQHSFLLFRFFTENLHCCQVYPKISNKHFVGFLRQRSSLGVNRRMCFLNGCSKKRLCGSSQKTFSLSYRNLFRKTFHLNYSNSFRFMAAFNYEKESERLRNNSTRVFPSSPSTRTEIKQDLNS